MSASMDALRVIDNMINKLVGTKEWTDAFGRMSSPEALPLKRFELIHRQHSVMVKEIDASWLNPHDGLFTVITMLYIWMPRMGVSLNPDDLDHGSVCHNILKKMATNPYDLNKESYNQLVKVIGVGLLMKLLYFFFPNVYPMLDRHVIKSLKDMGIYYGPISTYANFIRYVQLFAEINKNYTNDMTHNTMRTQATLVSCRNLTTVRTIEFLLYARNATKVARRV
jgi:hypothetical protein